METLQNSVIQNRSFDDFEELAVEARHWDLEFRQLDRGPFQGSVLQAVAGQLLFSEARFKRVLDQKGTAPAGLRTIGVPATPDVSFQWRNKQITGNDIFLFPENGELKSTSQTDFHVFIVSMPEALLQATFDDAEIDLNSLVKHEKLTGAATAMRSLRNHLQQLAISLKTNTRFAADGNSLVHAAEGIPGLFAYALRGHEQPGQINSGRLRDRAVHRATEFILKNSDRALTVTEVCREVEVSERTLQYAFLEHLGVSPKAYLLAVRLNGVRRDLKRATQDTSVNEVAVRWGFWHMSQLAVAYRRHFGELPSETLMTAQNLLG